MSDVRELLLPYQPQSEAEVVGMAIPSAVRRAARFAEQFKGSYRGFNVGAEIGVGKVRYKGLITVTAANYKANPIEGGPKVCAEEAGMHRLKKDIGHLITVHELRPMYVAVTASPQADIDSKLQFPTTHPCGNCRDRIEVLADPIIHASMPVVTVDIDKGIAQVFSIDELRQLHVPRYVDETQLSLRTFDVASADQVYSNLFEAKFEGLLEGLSTVEQVRLAWAA